MKKKKKEEILDEKSQVDTVENKGSLEDKDFVTEEESLNQDQRIKELTEKNEELNDRLLRRAAEFENYKKRTENEKEILFKYAAEPFILKIIPIYNDVQRSLAHIDDDNMDSLRDGYKMIADKFTQVLDDQGVKKIETLGKEFDYEFHEALLQQPSNDFPVNTIIEEIEAGYIYKDKVLKHAKVIVSQGPDENIKEEELDKKENAKE